MLLKKGAEVNARSNDGIPAIVYVKIGQIKEQKEKKQKSHHQEVMDLLIKQESFDPKVEVHGRPLPMWGLEKKYFSFVTSLCLQHPNLLIEKFNDKTLFEYLTEIKQKIPKSTYDSLKTKHKNLLKAKRQEIEEAIRDAQAKQPLQQAKEKDEGAPAAPKKAVTQQLPLSEAAAWFRESLGIQGDELYSSGEELE